MNILLWAAPSRTKFMLYSSLVLSNLLYSYQLWDLNTSCLQKTEKCPRFCLNCVFGKAQNTLGSNTPKLFRLFFLRHLNMMKFFVRLILGYYNFDAGLFVTHSAEIDNKRRICFNLCSVEPIVSVCSSFDRVLNAYNLSDRHGLIHGPSLDNVNSIRKFSKSKHFHLDNIDSSFFCNCSICCVEKRIFIDG